MDYKGDYTLSFDAVANVDISSYGDYSKPY